MRAIVALISAAAFLLHLGLGCCEHHSHALEGTRGRQLISHVANDHGHLHDPGSLPARPETPQHPGDSHDDCHESHSTFVLAGNPPIVKVLSSESTPPVRVDLIAPPGASLSTNWLVETGDLLPLSVRLHLMNQVMLI